MLRLSRRVTQLHKNCSGVLLNGVKVEQAAGVRLPASIRCLIRSQHDGVVPVQEYRAIKKLLVANRGVYENIILYTCILIT